MKYIYKILICLFCLLYFTIGQSFAANHHSIKNHLIFCMDNSPILFVPSLTTDFASFNVANQMYNQLVRFKLGTSKLIPSLATSWDVSKDQKIYTFHIRKGVKFQTTSYFKPTRNLNADDVVFSFDMQRNAKNPFNKMAGSDFGYYASMGFTSLIQKVIKVDDYTVKFYLNRKESPFVSDLAIPSFGIVSKEYADQILKQGKDIITFSNQPIGTGPFTFNSYTKDSFIRFTANKNYWEGMPSLDKLTFLIVPNSSTRTIKLQKGECDIITYPNINDITRLKKDPNVTVYQKTGLNVGYIGFNTAKKPFNNKLVRQALNYSVNKKALIKSIFRGHAIEANGIVPPSLWSYNKNVVKYPFNLKKAKRLLAKAGYPNGFKAKLLTRTMSPPYMPNAKRAAEMLQADWKKIGVDISILSYENGEYLHRLKTNDPNKDIFFMGWTGDTNDPDNFLYVLSSCAAINDGANYSAYCNKKFDSLLIKAKQTTNLKERIALYKKAQVVFAQDAARIPLVHTKTAMAARKNVRNFILDPIEKIWLFNITFK